MDHVEGPLHILLVEKEGQPYHTSYISSFSLFSLSFRVIHWRGRKESMMDHIERRRRILVALALYWCLHMIVQHVLDMQALALNGEWENALILSICFEGMKTSNRSVWAFKRNVGFTDRLLLGSFTEKMFKQRTRVCHNTFKFLCEKLGPYLQRKNTQMRETISVESRIAMSLQRLGTGNTLCTVGEVYGVAESTISEIV